MAELDKELDPTTHVHILIKLSDIFLVRGTNEASIWKIDSGSSESISSFPTVNILAINMSILFDSNNSCNSTSNTLGLYNK